MANSAEDGPAAHASAAERHRRARALLAQSEERLRLAAEAAGFGVHDADLVRQTRTWSDRLYALMGVAPGTPVSDADLVQRIHPDDRARVLTLLSRPAANLTAGTIEEFRIVHGVTGAVRWVQVWARTWFDESVDPPRPLRRTGIVMDITERKRSEEVLQAMNRQKDELIAMLAHELRNPLAPIRTAIDLLASHDHCDGVVARCRTVIDRQVQQMARMLDDLLDVSRLSRGEFVLVRRAVSLAEVVSAAVETSRPLVRQSRQQLTVEPVPADCVVDGDPVRLTQVLANLLNNAAKYGAPGGRIAVRAEAQDGWVRVQVQDTGPGLAPEVRARLFEPFVRGDEARRQSPDGMGVGLALARRLVDLHGGTIAVESGDAGGGTSMVVTLPLLPVPAAASVAVPTARWQSPTLAGTRVLVADDNVDAAEMLRLWLRRAGCEVRVAYDGAAALRAAGRFRPDVLLLDLSMPDTDGYEVCRRIRGKPWGQAMGIVAVSGWGQDAHLRRSAAAGFDHHLLKPVDPEALLHLLAEAPWGGRRQDPPW